MLSLERNSGLFKKKKKKNEADESQISGGDAGKVENLEEGWRCEIIQPGSAFFLSGIF